MRAALALTALALLAAALLLPGLDAIDLWAPDEPRYAQIAEEVRAQRGGPGDLVLLRLAGEPYTQKPPLYYWLAALAGASEGRVSERAARLPSALAGIACVVGVAFFGFRLFGPRLAPGLWAGALLLTTWRFAYSARRAQLDVLLTLFEGLAFFACWQHERGRGSRAVTLLLHAALSLAVLTKGPVGFLPLAAYAIYLLWQGRLEEIRPLVVPWAFLVSLGPALLWLGAAVALAPAGFFAEAVVDNVLGRFFSGTAHVRPFFYYLYQLPADALPWVLLAPLVAIAWRSPEGGAGPQRSAWRFLACGVATSVAFFSLSAGKRGVYLLPIFPWLALLAGAALDLALSGRLEVPPRLVRLGRFGAAALGGVVGISGLGIAVASLLGLEIAGSTLPASLGAALAGAGALVLAAARLGQSRGSAALCVAGAAIALAALFQLALPALDARKSARPIAQEAARLAPSGSAIGVFHHEALIGAMAYYGGGHPVRFVREAPELRRFLAEGGRVVVARNRFEEELAAAAGLHPQRSWRAGERRIGVFVPESRRAPGGEASPRANRPDSQEK